MITDSLILFTNCGSYYLLHAKPNNNLLFFTLTNIVSFFKGIFRAHFRKS